MKYALVFILIFPLIAFTQRTGYADYDGDKITYSGVLILDSSYKREDLFDNALMWISDATRHYNNLIQNKIAYELKDNIVIQNRDSGEIVATLRMFNAQNANVSVISYDVLIYLKDGRYKYTFSNFLLIASSLANNLVNRNVSVSVPLEGSDTKSRTSFMKRFKLEIEGVLTRMKRNMSYKKPSKDF